VQIKHQQHAHYKQVKLSDRT